MNHLPSCPTIENPRSICNCPTTPIEDGGWEERYEKAFPRPQDIPTHYSDVRGKPDCKCFACKASHSNIKQFIRAELATEKARVVAIVENEMRKNEDMYGMTPINLTMDCIKEKLK